MEEQIDIIDILLLLWKKKIIIIGVTLIFALVTFLKVGVIGVPKVENVVQNQKYYAQTTFTIGSFSTSIKTSENLPISINYARDTTDSAVETYSAIIKSQKILNNVINNLNLNITTQELENCINVTKLNTSNVVSIIVANDDESQSIKIANELMSEFRKTITDVNSIDQVIVIDDAYIVPERSLVEADISLEASKSSIIKKVCIVSLVGFVLSAGGVIIVNFLSNVINNENDIDTKLLGIVENNKTEDVFDILRIKLEKNEAMVITSLENSEKATSVINGIAKAFEKNEKKVLLLNAQDISSTSESEFKKYDYIIVNAKNILEDASSLMAVQKIKNTILLITERKTKWNIYKRAKETLKDVDANLLGSILIR